MTDEASFHDAMRRLWEDHINWTRLYIVSATSAPGGLPDLVPTRERLLANQVDIGDAIKPFYGAGAGEQLTALLTDHILIAADIVAGATADDKEMVQAALELWYGNGDDIATFLSGANPDAWPSDLMRGHMRTHLDLTLEEAVARVEGRYEDAVAASEMVHAQILAMADILSEGIVSQFPQMFAP